MIIKSGYTEEELLTNKIDIILPKGIDLVHEKYVSHYITHNKLI